MGEILVAITACVEQRKEAFLSRVVIDVFIDALARAAAQHDCKVPIYCFMPDHLHLIVEGCTRNSDTKAAVEAFKQTTGWWFKQNMPGVEWQEDFFDHIIRHSEDWRQQAQYIAGNPVRGGLVEDPLSYPFTGSIGYDLRVLLTHGL